ncbi:MAG TPA: 16S rRNA (cytosine(1402)-N(4))-methyltransferase RsmH [Saprospiraceae bacterium]|nr:16S rRNA (cytosine(1402)-N(4))-methyltransferase RsmH [Saprospiraceae bacterium]
MNYHEAVLLNEAVDALVTTKDGIYIDLTFGGGGHSREILKRISSKARLFSFDQDDAVRQHLPEDQRFVLIASNFRYLMKYLQYYGVTKVDGILADLGVSSHHFDNDQRGFSYRSNSPLDMRMNRSQAVTAADILMNSDAKRLEFIFKEYGELTNARKLADRIVKERDVKNWKTCEEFSQWVEPMGYGKLTQYWAKVFQALRIEVNEEMESLQEALEQASNCLKREGRLVVISYHSLEDRMVKNALKAADTSQEDEFYGRKRLKFKPMVKETILPSEDELEKNSRSRSAKMRVGIKL